MSKEVKPTNVQLVLKNNYHKEVTESMSLHDMYLKVKNLDYQYNVDQYKIHGKKKDEVLPALMPHMTSGTQYQALDKAGEWQYTNLIHLDIDDVPTTDRMNEVKDRLRELNPILMFTSPSGDGLKVFFNVDLSQFQTDKDLFRHTTKRWTYNTMKSIGALDLYDGNVCRPNNLCYVSVDEDAEWNSNSRPQTQQFYDAFNEYQGIQKQITDNNKRISMISRLVSSEGKSNIDVTKLVNSKITSGIETGDQVAFNVWAALKAMGASYDDGVSALRLVFARARKPNWSVDQKATKYQRISKFKLTGKKEYQEALDPNDQKALDEFEQTDKKLSKEITLTNDYVRVQYKPMRMYGESVDVWAGMPSSGKSYLKMKDIVNTNGDVFIYACHEISTLKERAAEISKIQSNTKGSLRIETFCIQSKMDGESAKPIQTQLDNIVTNTLPKSQGKNVVVFITHEALIRLDFEDLLKESRDVNLVVDEIPDLFEVGKWSRINRKSRQELLSMLETEEDTYDGIESHFITGLTDHGDDVANTIGELTNKEYKRIIENVSKSNLQAIIDFEVKKEGEQFRVVTMPNVKELTKFDSVCFMGDDAHNSLLLLKLKMEGVRLDVTHLKPRHSYIADRIKGVYVITNQTFGKFKLDSSNGDVERAIVSELMSVDGLQPLDIYDGYKMLFLANSISFEGKAMTAEMSRSFSGFMNIASAKHVDPRSIHDTNVLTCTANTHGINYLDTCNYCVCAYSLKPHPAQLQNYIRMGFTQDQVYRWLEYNSHFQNVFRPWLRQPDCYKRDQDPKVRAKFIEEGYLVLPDKGSLDYFLMRIEEQFSVEERKKLENKVKYFNNKIIDDFFSPNKDGRPTKDSSGVAMSDTERNKLMRWRKNKNLSPELVDDVHKVMGKDIFEMKLKDLKGLVLGYKLGKPIENLLQEGGFVEKEVHGVENGDSVVKNAHETLIGSTPPSFVSIFENAPSTELETPSKALTSISDLSNFDNAVLTEASGIEGLKAAYDCDLRSLVSNQFR
ncbi:BT4734/BF3469 family protein [Vibrio sp. nBUS_14]|uniref:BT4734/BF3469 family protein n=1 Tax=Vibrio sp. nBUS_14 TaxID=3395321 RepID=UPI003EBE8190